MHYLADWQCFCLSLPTIVLIFLFVLLLQLILLSSFSFFRSPPANVSMIYAPKRSVPICILVTLTRIKYMCQNQINNNSYALCLAK